MSNAIEFTIKAKDEFSDVMKQQESVMNSLSGTFKALGIAAAVYGAIKIAQASLDNAEAMGTAAGKANMTTEAYSALAWAAQMSNVEVGAFSAGMRGLNKAMAEGEGSSAGLALSAIGVASRDANGELRTTEDVLYDVADAFAASKDDANKTKVAMDIFSKAGKDMVPFLNEGSDSIRAMMEDAKKLGMVIGNDFAKSADQINDNMATMAAVIGGSVNVAMAELAPTIELITGEMVQFLTEGNAVQTAGSAIATTFKVLMSVGSLLAGTFRQLGMILGATAAAIMLTVTGDFSGAVNVMKDLDKDLEADSKKTHDNIAGYWDGSAQSAAAAAAKTATDARKLKESMAIVNKASEDARKEAEKLAKAIKDTGDSMYSAIQTTGLSTAQTKAYELGQKGATGAEYARVIRLAELTTKMEEHNKLFAEATGIINGQLTPLEQHNDKIARMNELYALGEMSADQHTKAIERETDAWRSAEIATEGYKNTATNSITVAARIIEDKMQKAGSVSYQVGVMIANVYDSVVKGFGDAAAEAIVSGKNLSDSLTSLFNTVLKTIISTLIQIGVQRALLSAGIITSYAAEAAASTSAAGVMVATGTAVSIAWGPIALIALAIIAAIYVLKQAMEIFGPVGVAVGIAVSTAFIPVATVALAIVAAIWLIKEAFEILGRVFDAIAPVMVSLLMPVVVIFETIKSAVEAVTDAVKALADAMGGISGGIGGIVGGIGDALSFSGGGYTGNGARTGGVDGLGGFPAILHPNETVIDHNIGQGSVRGGIQSMQSGGTSSGGGSVVIQNLTIHIMENATNVDAYSRMDKIALRNTLGQPVVDALNEMFSIGVRPNFATQGR